MPTTRNEKLPRGVSRIDHRRTHGWLARAYARGCTHARLFSDRTYGDAETAYTIALAWAAERRAALARMQRPRAVELPRIVRVEAARHLGWYAYRSRDGRRRRRYIADGAHGGDRTASYAAAQAWVAEA